MSKKGENVYKRRDGRWEARYVKSHDLSGKIVYGYCYGKTYREAKEKAARARAEVLLHEPPSELEPGKRHFLFYCEEWLQMQKGQVRESTYVKYELTIHRHIGQKLGRFYPQDITTSLIEAFKKEMLQTEGLAPKTVKDVLLLLRSILRYNRRQFPGLFQEVEIIYPRESKKETRVLTREEQQHFISYLLEESDPCKMGTLLALMTGMRIGEACALQWKHISQTERIIHVCSTMQRLKDLSGEDKRKTKVVITDPKSDSSARLIPLSDNALSICEKMGPKDPDNFILTGSPHFMEPRTLQYRLKKYTSDCGLDGVHFHTLRHTFATRCVEVGFELKSLSEILGHSNTSITLDRYVHSSMALKRENMNKLSSTGL